MFGSSGSQDKVGPILPGHGFQHVAPYKSMTATLDCVLSMVHGLRPSQRHHGGWSCPYFHS